MLLVSEILQIDLEEGICIAINVGKLMEQCGLVIHVGLRIRWWVKIIRKIMVEQIIGMQKANARFVMEQEDIQ